MRSRFYILILVCCVILTSLLALNHFVKQNDSNIESVKIPHELWEIDLQGQRKHSQCNGLFDISLKATVLFKQSLSQLLSSPSSMQINGYGVTHTIEKSSNLQSTDTTTLQNQVVASWVSLKNQPQLQINFISSNPLIYGNCIKQKIVVTDSMTQLLLKSETFLNNGVQGQWAFGKFDMKLVSGPHSLYPISAPLNVKAIAASENVTVSWSHFPGAQGYKVYVYSIQNDPKNDSALRTLETRENFSIVTGLPNQTVFRFAVSAIIDGYEVRNQSSVIARPGDPLTASQVVAGNHHACALLFEKKVVCWGANDKGQMGDGTKTNFSLPVSVTALKQPVRSLESMAEGTCAILESGDRQCWGGDDTNPFAPNVSPIKDKNVSREARGEDFLCYQLKDTSLRCFGNNHKGQLGTGDQIPQYIAIEPDYFKTEKLKANSVVSGKSFACLLNDANKVLCWGDNHLGQIGNGSGDFSPNPQFVRY